MQRRRVNFHTLGCKLNFSESSTLAREFEAGGFIRVGVSEAADISVINSCSVTEHADKKCRNLIRKIHRRNPAAIIVVTGCYAQLKPGVVSAIEGVDLVLGAEQKGDILKYLEERLPLLPQERKPADAAHESYTVAVKDIRTFAPSCSCGDRTRYFLKVQDGCDYYCTYCTIPFARGRSRNGSIASLVEQAEGVAREGGKEIVLTGVNIGDFGRTTKESFLDLIKALDQVEGIERYRISSIEPNLLTDEILQYCATSRAFMPHFHIPLQSGSDEVLRLMRRKYDTALFRSKVERIRELMPDAFIGVDVIVGTRGETEAYFEDACRFIESLDISQLHVFSYSERPGTKALEIDHQVSAEEKHRRSQILLELSDRKLNAFYRRYLGQERSVLLERSKNPLVMHGFTDNYIKVELHPDAPLEDNRIVKVRLMDLNEENGMVNAQLI